ncbi:multicomponent Na+:H+ antiporter subunit E [Halobaculum gomorrense]|uniref:Multicomponent Na+:H+ antiporter subunit E n=2 Tax=Halobaculum gomorrense TaxID=43928 RepID=A0A1M5P8D0_9EURY|nr:Na+/H+ antiporter subunit E [Halobaculum gomorrense]SHG98050.1 multicomponent Na+:H+ antiporter subunit E [Halobaculum gomorrense]
MRRWISNAVAFTALWIFVRGVELTPVRLVEEGLIGLLVSLPLAYAVRNFYGRAPVARSIRVLPSVGLYLLVFLRELLVANVAVARTVVSPSLPIDPAVVEVPLRVESDAAVTTIANSITLTPGTLTMDYDADANSLYVHSLDGDDILDPIRTWEDYALVIFNEPLKPGDPVPEPRDAAADSDTTAADSDDGGER